jgi:D-alanyl-D-alanine carboxypeptidase
MPAFNEALFKDVDIRSAISEQVTPERALQLAGSLPWDPASVGSFTYSDTDYMALALLVETLRHKAFAQVLREEIIDPLGLTDTSTQNLDLNDARVLHGYITLHGQRLDVTDNTWTVDSPAAGVTSTVADVNSFYAALFQGKLISAKSLAELKKRPSLAPYALGVWTWPDGCTAGTRFEGRGALWAYLTLAVSSEDGRYVAAMTLVAPPLPTQVEDPGSEARRDLWLSHMESALNETLDRLCQHPD